MEINDTSHFQRIEIVKQKQQGISLDTIAQQMNLNYYTVRKWWRRYRDSGWDGICPKQRGRTYQGIMSSFHPLVKYVALKLKRQHPGWGADLILLEMSRRDNLQGIPLPRRSLLYQYFGQFYPRFFSKMFMPTKTPQPTIPKTEKAHDRWQMDFKGEVNIENDEQISPFILCDEHTSAPLYAMMLPFRNQVNRGLTARDIQNYLRDVFSQWGLPFQLRMDRDPLWVGSARLQWPGIILLWLVGLGITPVINRPGRPTDNAQIERNNRCWKAHIYDGQKHNPESLQKLTDQIFKDRREQLPSRNPHCKGLPPVIANPDLLNNPRRYVKEQEKELFDIDRVYHYLSQWQWKRKVDKVGRITVNYTLVSIGRKYTRQVVSVTFDEHTKEFNVYSIDEIKLKSFTIPNITPEFIMGYGDGLNGQL